MGPTGDSRPRSAQPALAPSDGGDVGSAAIARYADELGAALDLPRVELDRVRQEIADHLADSVSALVLGGLEVEAATREAMNHLDGV
jgi:hypothetical protein